ncbi:hypothetical protein PAXINDRAFT_16906 [Paxillus involutus ATCC 200175]|uniref:Uncharacterized protein n=1 Tax=Paxillus involutus ATCC 200175 TaxID=664439 RepID=A0A0C9SQZ8_PAXIN|nr:hypothetical protein PAXINDRAFT_16906 [Paxillus involutus ATCC 200175]
MAEIPVLRTDGRNWSGWRENLERTLDELGVSTYISKTTPNPYNEQVNALAKCAIASTIPDSIFLQILHFKSAQECFETLRISFEKKSTATTTTTATTAVLHEVRNTRTTREAAYSPESASDVRDTSRCDNGVSDGSGRRNNNVPSNNTHRQRQREPKRQGRVKRGCGEGEEEGKLKGRKDEKAAAATGPGKGTTDQKASGVSLIKPTSSQDSPRARVDTPPSPPPSLTTPTMPVEQTAPTSRRPTRQRRRDGHVPRNGTCRTHEDDAEGSQGRAKSRSRGGREPDDKDGDDVDVDHAHVVPQHLETTRQTAYNKAADTSNPNAMSAGLTEPAGTSNEPRNELNKGEKGGEEDEKGVWASGIEDPSSNDDGGDKDVHHAYVVPNMTLPPPYHTLPTPDERRQPPSMPLEGEKNNRITTTRVVNHAAMKDAVQRDGSEDDTNTSNGINKWQSRRGEARDEATGDEESREAEGDEEGQKTRKGTREVEETTNVDKDGRYTSNEAGDLPPEPPPPTPHLPTPEPPQLDTAPSPSPPKRRDGDVNTAKLNKTPAQRRADAVHDPGGDMKTPDSKPPSIRLEGESGKQSSRHVEMDDDHAKDDDHTQQPSRHPVGTMDGDKRHPNGPTEPPDEVERGQGGNSEPREDERVESGDRGVEEMKSKEVEGEIGGQSEGDGGHRDGRMIDTGSPTSGTSCDSKRVETGALPDNETSQQHNGKPSTSTNVPGPPRPPPYTTNRPTHIANPPRRRGRLKTLPTNVSQPERTEYAPC